MTHPIDPGHHCGSRGFGQQAQRSCGQDDSPQHINNVRESNKVCLFCLDGNTHATPKRKCASIPYLHFQVSSSTKPPRVFHCFLVHVHCIFQGIRAWEVPGASPPLKKSWDRMYLLNISKSRWEVDLRSVPLKNVLAARIPTRFSGSCRV